MEYVRFGRTRREVSRIGLGGLAFGGGYGPIEKIDVLRTVHAALDQGITLFDTSPTYGDGRAEELLAEALGPDLGRVVIATKIGGEGVSEFTTWRTNDGPTITRRLEGSLRRLRREYVDVLQIYGPDPNTPPEHTMEALLRLQGEGKILHIGMCGADLPRLRGYHRHGRVETVLASCSMLNRTAEQELAPFCRSAGTALLACEPFLCGLLHGHLHRNSSFDAGDRRVLDPRFRGIRYRANVETVNRLRRVAEQEGLTLTALAFAWLFRNDMVTTAVCGARTASQVRQIVKASAARLTPERMLFVEQTMGRAMAEEPA